jgi:hypothetical protein
MKFKAKTNSQRKLDVRWDLIDLYVAKWKPGTDLDVEITRRQSKATSSMRKYYFAEVIAKYADHLGYDKGEEVLLLHTQLKIVYFQIKPDKKGIYLNVPHVFAEELDLSDREKVKLRKKFMDWVVRKAARDGCVVDDPRPKKTKD